MINEVNARLGLPAAPRTPLLSFLEERLARELVRYAAGHAIHCPKCASVLDAPAAVVCSDAQHNTYVQCAKCWAKPVGHIKAGSVTVYDGRALWPTRTKHVWKFAC